MIDLYAWATPNSIKVPILLEELGLAYALKPINIRQGEQKKPDYLKLNPNGKVPVIVDHDGPAGGADYDHGIGGDHALSGREVRPPRSHRFGGTGSLP